VTRDDSIRPGVSWVARFRDGPAADSPERVFAVGPVWQRIQLTPMPDPHGWTISGGDQMPWRTSEPWPGEVTYHLVELVLDADDPGAGDRIAYYELAPTTSDILAELDGEDG
jgi:hypothetical protein